MGSTAHANQGNGNIADQSEREDGDHDGHNGRPGQPVLLVKLLQFLVGISVPGRWLFNARGRQDRVDVPMVRRGATLAGVDWETAIAEAARVLAGAPAYVLASPMLSNEALFLLKTGRSR